MEEKERKPYPGGLTGEQREETAPLYTVLRSCTWSRRDLTDAVLYLVDSGRRESPDCAITESQNVKTAAAGEEHGPDGRKKRKAENGTSQ